MRLKKLKLQNFLSYGKLDFDFHKDANEDSAIYIIQGANNDTESSADNSNGSGKSTLVGESITFNLFGKNLRGSSKKVKLENAIKFGESTLINEAEYYINNKSSYASEEGNSDVSDNTSAILRIRREKERDGRSSLDIKVDGQDKSKRLKKLSENDIRDFLCIDPEVYYQTISYYKDNPSLLAMNYSQRLDYFKKLINLSLMDEYYAACKKYSAELDKKILVVKNKKQAILDIIEALQSNDSKYQTILQESIDKIKKEIAELESIPDIDVSKESAKLDTLLEALNKLNAKVRDYKADIRVNNVSIKELDKEIMHFNELKNTKCPNCGQEVSGKYADAIIETKKKIKESLVKTIAEKEELIETYAEKIVKGQDKEKKLRAKIEELKSENTIKKVKIQTLSKQLNEKEKELSSIAKALKTDAETDEYKGKLDKLTRAEELFDNRLKMTNFWLTNLAPKSPIRSAIIRKHINYLSDIFEYYLGKLFRNTIVGHIEIDDDGNIDILLNNDGNEVNYWNLSSGERKRADLALLFSLYVYLLNMIPDAPKFLICDEIYDALDYPGKLFVTETIKEIYGTYKIDIFIISHVDFPTEVFDGCIVKNIMVTKNNGSSSAQYI